MDALNSIWRSLVRGGGPDDAAEGRRLLGALHSALAAAVRARGVQALSSSELASIRVLVDQLLPAHFGLKVPTPEESAARPAGVSYQHVYEDETFSMGIFILSPGAKLPLHDHPGMSVVSRVLYGSLRVTSFDLTDDAPGPRGRRRARVHRDAELAAPHTTDLSPDRGNLHEFEAGSERGCAIFDILTPPYDERDGRDCTYYRVVAPAADGDADAAMLEPFVPEFEVRPEAYHGPRLQRYV